jgi:glucarate dehydratase
MLQDLLPKHPVNISKAAAKKQDIVITPVAFHDPPLLSAIGVHVPYALQSIFEVIRTTTAGLGKSYGDSTHISRLQAAAEKITDMSMCDTNAIYRTCAECLNDDQPTGCDGIVGMVTTASVTDKVFSPFEVVCLDIHGKILGYQSVPCWAPRPEKWWVQMGADESWSRRRNGFNAIKLRAGVFPPQQEVDAIKVLHKAFPDIPLRIDPNAAWSVKTSKWVAKELDGMLAYLEDPAPEFEGMAALAKEVSMPLAAHMAIVVFNQLPFRITQNALHL